MVRHRSALFLVGLVGAVVAMALSLLLAGPAASVAFASALPLAVVSVFAATPLERSAPTHPSRPHPSKGTP